MTAYKYLYIIMIGLVALGGVHVCAEGTSSLTAPSVGLAGVSTEKGLAPDGTPIVHKSFHKKKNSALVSSPRPTTPVFPTAPQSPRVVAPPAIVTAPGKPTVSIVIPPPTPTLGPIVETGLPVAKHSGTGVSDVYTPIAKTSVMGATTHQQLIASAFPLAPGTSSSVGIYSNPSRTTTTQSAFPFVNFSKKVKNVYPWKTNIITTMFYIGEGGSTISSTDNIASAWDENWRSSNRGPDNPNNRSGYGPADHAATVNTFYVALPFNDLYSPELARRWLPAGWHRPDKDGKQVSACQHRWVEIKNADGHICYAQWEDVGPLNSTDAEYVFGNARPQGLGDHRAGLDISPAVAQYLNLDDKRNRYMSWRFVDDEDVPPGQWLRYDEMALLTQAIMQQKNTTPRTTLPIQRASQPIDDTDNVDANKKKIGSAKG